MHTAAFWNTVPFGDEALKKLRRVQRETDDHVWRREEAMPEEALLCLLFEWLLLEGLEILWVEWERRDEEQEQNMAAQPARWSVPVVHAPRLLTPSNWQTSQTSVVAGTGQLCGIHSPAEMGCFHHRRGWMKLYSGPHCEL